MTAYQRKILKDIAEATYSRNYCEQKAWEFASMREDSTTAMDYLESVKSWNGWIETLRKLANEEKLTEKQINNAIDKYHKAMQEG